MTDPKPEPKEQTLKEKVRALAKGIKGTTEDKAKVDPRLKKKKAPKKNMAQIQEDRFNDERCWDKII